MLTSLGAYYWLYRQLCTNGQAYTVFFIIYYSDYL